MKKILCMMILLAVLVSGGCDNKVNSKPAESPPPQVTDKIKPEQKPKSSEPQRIEKKLLEMSFSKNGGISVSASNASSSISNGQAQISFKIPEGFKLWGNFNVSEGQISLQIFNGQNVLLEDKPSVSSREEFFNLPPGNYKFNINDLRYASGKIVLRLVPTNNGG